MQVISQNSNRDDQPKWSDGRPHNCDESLGDDEVKLACGCMLPVVAGADSREGERKLNCICAGMTPCSVGSVNGHKFKVMRDTGSVTYVVKQSLVEAEQMTRNHELCMVIDGVVKRFPTAVVKINTLYYKGAVKALCMENPVQELIVGNVLGATGVEVSYEMTEQSEVISDDKHEDEYETQHTEVEKEDTEKMSEIENVINNTENSEMKQTVIPDEENDCAAVQTRAMRANESKPQKPLKVTAIPVLDIGPEQLVEQQKTDQALKKYYQRKEQGIENDNGSDDINESEVSQNDGRMEQVADISCVIDDGIDENSEFEIEDDKELLALYSVKQKETVNDVVINLELSPEQQSEVRSLLREYKEIFSDVPKVTNLIEHKVELTQREPVRCKACPTPYKIQEIVNKEIDDLLKMGVIEHSEAPYASPLVP